MEALGAALLALAGLVHLPPAVGVLGTRSIERLYGVTVGEPAMAILMRHRAILFGLLGTLLIAAAWIEALRPAAVTGGLISDAAFLLVAGDPRRLEPAMRRVAVVDVASVVLIVIAGALLLSA